MHSCNQTCELFQRLSIGVAANILDACQLGLLYQEETISENLLLGIAKDCPNVKIRSFKRHEETKNGSDWEWWIKRDRKWLHMRVQAKKMRASGAVFQRLLKQSPNPASPTQIDTLIKEAKTDKALAAYCFYVGDDLNYAHAPLLAGCFIANATKIQNGGSNKWTDIHKMSEPWYVLVCTCKNQAHLKSVRPELFFIEDGQNYMKDELPSYLTNWDFETMYNRAKERQLAGYIKIEIAS